MALQAFVTSITGVGIRGNLGGVDHAFVAAGVTIASTNDIAISGSGSWHKIDVYGTVLGHFRAIFLDIAGANNHVYVGATGYLGNYTFGAYTARIESNSSTLENDGTIVGRDYGVSMGGTNAATVSTLINTGTIKATAYAIGHTGRETLEVFNSGIVKGGFDNFGGGISKIVNTGTFNGYVFFGSNNDTFDTRKGTYTGTVEGGAGNDKIYGSNAANTFNGGSGNDRLFGYAGNDKLNGGADRDYIDGGAGNDTITGGQGRDELIGGAGADTFVFTSIGDSTNVSANRDIIRDFSQTQKDKINLSQIDARLGGADDAFTFIGKAAFSGTAGELRYVNSSGQTRIYGDIDGDKVIDFAVWLDGTLTMKAADFVL